MIGRALPILALAVEAVVAACSSGGAPTTSSIALDDHTYLSTAIQGATLVPGTQVRLIFAKGNLTASGGCNIMGGVYSIDGDRLTSSQVSMTEMACDDARQRQDDWLSHFLGVVTFTVDGDSLTLTDGSVTLVLLEKEVANPDQPLAGTSWLIDGITSGDAVSSVPSGVTATIQISGDRVQVNAGCNTGRGTVQVTTDAITFGPIALTKMACGPEATAVETAIITVLTGTVRYTIDADVLTLAADDRGLTFRTASCTHCRPSTSASPGVRPTRSS